MLFQALRWVAVLLVVSASLGCGQDNRLEGSIGSELSLAFDTVEFRKQSGFLVVQYLRRSPDAKEIVCRIAADATALPDDRVYTDDVFLQRVTLSRATLDATAFPEVAEGTLRLDELSFEQGGAVSGSLDALFRDGRTLSARFTGTIVEVLIP